jgi:hypothetical protein
MVARSLPPLCLSCQTAVATVTPHSRYRSRTVAPPTGGNIPRLISHRREVTVRLLVGDRAPDAHLLAPAHAAVASVARASRRGICTNQIHRKPRASEAFGLNEMTWRFPHSWFIRRRQSPGFHAVVISFPDRRAAGGRVGAANRARGRAQSARPTAPAEIACQPCPSGRAWGMGALGTMLHRWRHGRPGKSPPRLVAARGALPRPLPRPLGPERVAIPGRETPGH